MFSCAPTQRCCCRHNGAAAEQRGSSVTGRRREAQQETKIGRFCSGLLSTLICFLRGVCLSIVCYAAAEPITYSNIFLVVPGVRRHLWFISRKRRQTRRGLMRGQLNFLPIYVSLGADSSSLGLDIFSSHCRPKEPRQAKVQPPK